MVDQPITDPECAKHGGQNYGVIVAVTVAVDIKASVFASFFEFKLY